MTATNQPNLDDLELRILQLLDDATSMQVGLTDDDSEYDLNFISDKLKKVSVYQERLSDILMKLTRMSLEIKKRSTTCRSLSLLKEKELKASDGYQEQERSARSYWVENQLSDLRQEAERWEILARMVSEVKEAVAERAGTMKRLDSDIRLHTKIYEARVAAGATSPASYTGHSTTEVDID